LIYKKIVRSGLLEPLPEALSEYKKGDSAQSIFVPLMLLPDDDPQEEVRRWLCLAMLDGFGILADFFLMCIPH